MIGGGWTEGELTGSLRDRMWRSDIKETRMVVTLGSLLTSSGLWKKIIMSNKQNLITLAEYVSGGSQGIERKEFYHLVFKKF